MGHRVRLTWRPDDNYVIVEECTLLSETDPVYTVCEHGHIMEIEGAPKIVADLMKDKVMFEDEHGIFGIPPLDIIDIELL